MSFGLTHLTPVVLDFMQAYPQIQVQLDLSDEKRDPLSNQFDMTLRIGPPENNPALIEHDITYTSRCLCAAPEFLQRYGTPGSPNDLKDRRDLLLRRLASYMAISTHKDGKGGINVDIKGVGPLVTGNIAQKFEVARTQAKPEKGQPENSLEFLGTSKKFMEII